MADYDIVVDGEPIQSKLNRYKLQYRREYARRCTLESEISSKSDLLRLTTEKLKSALSTITEQKSTIRYLERKLVMDKSLLDTMDVSTTFSMTEVVSRSTAPAAAAFLHRGENKIPTAIMELLVSQQSLVKALVKRLQKQNDNLVNIKNILKTVLGKGNMSNMEMEPTSACDSISEDILRLTKQDYSDPINGSSHTRTNSHSPANTTLSQPNRPRAAPRSINSIHRMSSVQRKRPMRDREVNSSSSEASGNEGASKVLNRNCPACNRQFADKSNQSSFEQHFIDCVDNLCHQAAAQSNNTPLRVDLNANLKLPPQTKPHSREDASQDENKTCPACDIQFRSETDQASFERHVLGCVEKLCQQDILGAGGAEGKQLANDKICPMCETNFPPYSDQHMFERHVLSHFDDETTAGM